MDCSRDQVTLNEFKFFYGIDRELYVILVRDLCRNPSECLQIMGFWLLLERGGFGKFISKILSFAPFLINELVDEALTFLRLVNNQFPLSSEPGEIPLTTSLMKTNIPFKYFYDNRRSFFHNIQRLVSDVYIPVLSDIMEMARHSSFGESSGSNNQTRNQSFDESLVESFSSLSIQRDVGPSSVGQAHENKSPNQSPRCARTMFATFSKGYPVTEIEMRQYFKKRFGKCIDSFRMHDVKPDEQPLYAKIVFLSPFTIITILNGETKAKLTIRGKHVWMRQFVQRNGKMLLGGCSSTGPSICPHRE